MRQPSTIVIAGLIVVLVLLAGSSARIAYRLDEAERRVVSLVSENETMTELWLGAVAARGDAEVGLSICWQSLLADHESSMVAVSQSGTWEMRPKADDGNPLPGFSRDSQFSMAKP